MSTPVRTCSHPRPNGDGCTGLVLKGKTLCYYHHREYERRLRIEQNLEYRRKRVNYGHAMDIYKMLPDGRTFVDDNSAALFNALQLPSLEDADGIQIALTATFRALATGQLDYRAARLMLQDLRIAARTLKHTMSTARDYEVFQDNDDAPLPDVVHSEAPPPPTPEEIRLSIEEMRNTPSR